MSLTYLDEDSILSNYAGKPSGQHNFNHGSRIYRKINRSEASPRNVSLKSPSHNESKNQTYYYISQRNTSVSKDKQSQKKLKTRGRTKADDDTRKSKYDKPTRISVLSHDLDDSSLILSPKIESCNKSMVESNKKKELLRNLIKSKKKDTRAKHVQANSKLALFSPYSSTVDPTLAAHSASIVSFSKKIRADSSKKRTLLKQDSHSSEKRMNASAGQSMHKLPKVISQSQDSDVCDDKLNKTAPFRTIKTKNSSMQNSFLDSRPVIASPSTKINERPSKSRKQKSILEDLKLPRTGSMPSRITDMSFENDISIEVQDKSVIYTPENLDITNNYHSHNSPSKSKGIEENITHKQKSTGDFEKSQINQQNYPPKSAAQKVHRIIKVFSIESKPEADKKGNKNIPKEESVEREVAKKSELPQPIKNYTRPQSPPKSILQKEMTYQHSPKFSRPEEPPKMSINERYEQLLKGNIEEKFSELERIFRGKKNRKKVSFTQI